MVVRFLFCFGSIILFICHILITKFTHRIRTRLINRICQNRIIIHKIKLFVCHRTTKVKIKEPAKKNLRKEKKKKRNIFSFRELFIRSFALFVSTALFSFFLSFFFSFWTNRNFIRATAWTSIHYNKNKKKKK